MVEGFATFFTFVMFDTRMNPMMLSEAGTIGKGFAAFLTFVGFFSGMTSRKAGTFIESCVAIHPLGNLVLNMDILVDDEFRVLMKDGVAPVAFVKILWETSRLLIRRICLMAYVTAIFIALIHCLSNKRALVII